MTKSTQPSTTKFEAFIVNPLEEPTLSQQGKIKQIDNKTLMYQYEAHAIVYAVVNKIVNNILVDGYFFLKDGEEVQDANTEKIQDIFRGTNGDSDIIITMRQVVKDMLVCGDAYLEKVAFNPRVVKIDRISPKYMRKKINAKGEVLGYGQYMDGRWITSFDKDEVFSEGLNNGDVYGISPLEASFLELKVDVQSIIFNGNFFKNDATPMTIWELNPELGIADKNTQELIKKQLLSAYQGAVKSGKPVMSNVVKDVKVIDRDLNKLQFLDSRDKFIEKICSAFDMSKSVLGITDSANESTASNTMRKQFYITAVRPKEQMIERFMNSEILPALGFEGYTMHVRERDFDDMAEKVSTVSEMRKNGLITENEARVMLGLPKIEEDWANQYSVLTSTGYVPATDMQDVTPEQSGLIKSISRLIQK